MGMMVPVPFILWLIGNIIQFGNIEQLFAIIGIIGIALNFMSWKKDILKSIISFIMMILPIANRLLQLPLENFNYGGFIIPFIIFLTSYSLLIILKFIKLKPI